MVHLKMLYTRAENMGVLCATFLQLFLLVAAEAVANEYVENAKDIPSPKFLPTNANFNHHVGDTAVLECAVEDLGRKKVAWRKASENSPLTVGLVSFVSDPRIEVEHPPGSSQWNLVIRNVQPEDAGVYECQISSKIRHLRHHVTLLVKDEPREDKQTIQITGQNYVDEGERIFLQCNATARHQPPEDLDWFREGNRLQTSEADGISIRKSVTLATLTIVSILEIKHARLRDAGVYVCRTSSLDVTSFRVNVLNGDTFNVKRGSEADTSATTATAMTRATTTSVATVKYHDADNLNVDINRGGNSDKTSATPTTTLKTRSMIFAKSARKRTETDHTEDALGSRSSASSSWQRGQAAIWILSLVVLVFNHLPSNIT